MSTWTPIKLRLRGSDAEIFDGETDFAGGGAGAQAVYTGNSVNIANGASGDLTFDTLALGPALLDISTPDAPTFLTAGVYAVALNASGDALTAAGYATLGLAATGGFAFTADTEHPEDTWATSLGVCVVAAGDPLLAVVNNFDGAAARNFAISACSVVKL